MKRLMIIMLTVLLVTAVFVSCKVEVSGPPEGTVTVRFRTEDTARSLNSARETLDTSKYYWYYTAAKTDDSPATGTKVEETLVGTNGKLTEAITDSFSLGKWNFVLKGYTSTGADKTLVYSGSVKDYELKDDTRTIDITVEPQKTPGKKGTLKVEEGIKFTANGRGYTATKVTVSGVDGGSDQTQPNAENGYYTYTLDSGSYKVTVIYESGGVTYAVNTIYVNVWNSLTTTVGGTLDEITIKASFDAKENTSDGSVAQTAVLTDNTEATYSFVHSPANHEFPGSSSDLGTTVKGTFAKTEGATEARITVTTYDTVSAGKTGTFTVADGSATVAALEITLENASIKDDGVAVVTTYISKGLSSVKLYHSNNQMDETAKDNENEVTANGNWSYDSSSGKLVFATSSFSPFHVTSQMNVYDSDNNVSYKLEKKGEDYKLYDKDGQEATVQGTNLVLLDCSLSNAVPDDLLSKNWTVIHARCAENTGFWDVESSHFSGGRGTRIEPYLIADKDQFQKITDMYDKYAYYRIKDGVTEIDCSDWTSVKLFGSFDGNGVKLKGLNQKLFYYVGKLPSTKEAAAVLANWDTTPVVLKNFEANFNLEADLDAAAGMIYQINGNNTTTIDNVTISGRMAGGSNSGAFFTYTGPNYYDQDVTGMQQKIVVNNSLVTAELICTAPVGVICGHPKYSNSGVVVYCDKSIDELFKGTAVVPTGSKVCLSAFYFTYVGKNNSTTNEETTTGVSYMATQVPGYDASTGYSVNWADSAVRMEVYIAAQLDETEENSDTRTAVVGITLTLKHMETKTKSEGNTSEKVLETFSSVELMNKQSGYDAAIESGKLTAKTAGDVNYTCGRIKLQVAQYDTNGKMVAFGSKTIAGRTTYNGDWTINPQY